MSIMSKAPMSMFMMPMMPSMCAKVGLLHDWALVNIQITGACPTSDEYNYTVC